MALHTCRHRPTVAPCYLGLALSLVVSMLSLGLCVAPHVMPNTIVGEDCKVRDPIRNYEFNVNGLYKVTEDYKIITNSRQLFYVNICGSLKKPCNGQHNVSVCLVPRNGNEIAIGYSNNSIVFEEGRLNFELRGDECKSGIKSKVIIILKCDDTASLDAGPEIWPSFGDCVFYFIWFNHLSCTPHKEIECSTTDNYGRIYDLNRLALHSSNYMVLMKQNSSDRILRIELNVCHSVVFGHSVMCEFNSGACGEDPLAPLGPMINLGDISRGPFFENGKLQLKYEMGDICREDGPRLNMSTIIEFVCDETKYESQPMFVSNHHCTYHFLWQTSAACPVDLTMSPEWVRDDEGGQVCINANPSNDHQFDLRPLMGKDYKVVVNKGHTLLLGICGPLKNSTCESNVGSCLIDTNSTKQLDLGRANVMLRTSIPDSKPFLLYSNGAPCENGAGLSWRTRIFFICGAEGYGDGPHFVSTSNCTYVINWHTELVCKREVQCVATQGNVQVNLTPLVNTLDYMTKEKDNVYIVNVCRSLRSALAVNCPLDSAACIMGTPSKKELSLGYPVDSPSLNEKGEAVLNYINGSPCPSKPEVRLSSSFLFTCDIMVGLGHPTFLNISNQCHYEFLWRTSFVCKNQIEESNLATDSCFIQDKATNTTVDLSSLHKAGGHRVVGFSSKNYTINLCTSNDTCSGAPVCEEITFSANDKATASYGQIDKVEHDFSSNYTKLFYSNGAPCVSTGKFHSSSEVWLKCDEGAGIGEPTVLSESDECYVLFEWRTAAACGKVTVGPGDQGTIIPRRKQASVAVRLAIGFGIVLIVVTCLAIVYCRKSKWCVSVKNRLSDLVGFRTQVVYRRQAGDNDDWSENCAMT